MSHELRPYQKQIIDDARDAFRRGHRSILVVLPTGGGKTRVGAEFVMGASAKGKRTLWLAHRQELISQARDRLIAEGIPKVGVIAAQLKKLADPDAIVQVASLQTLTARELMPKADLVIFDEAHHYVASEWYEFAAQYKDATRIGLTATPQRSDGVGLGELFSEMVIGPSIADLTKMGYLVKCEVSAPDKLLRNALAKSPAQAWLEHGRPKSVVFCNSVAHAKEVEDEFNEEGANVETITGTTPNEERQRNLEAFHKGKLNVLVNVFVLTEGWDCPSVEACILARPVGSAGMYLQMVGRILRPAPGKERALLIDLPGVSWKPKLGLPDDPRKFTLDGEGICEADEKIPMRQCIKCGMVSRPTSPQCEHCGAPWPISETAIPAIANEKLIKREKGQPSDTETMRTYYENGLKIAKLKGYKIAWAAVRFKDKFGSWPKALGIPQEY